MKWEFIYEISENAVCDFFPPNINSFRNFKAQNDGELQNSDLQHFNDGNDFCVVGHGPRPGSGRAHHESRWNVTKRFHRLKQLLLRQSPQPNPLSTLPRHQVWPLTHFYSIPFL